MPDFEDRLKDRARALGFALVGIAPAVEADGFGRLKDWLARGYAGTMGYIHRHGDARRHPSAVLPEVRSVVVVAWDYAHAESSNRKPEHGTPVGKVARYAAGRDYHDILRARLNDLLDWVRSERPSCSGRGVVDTAPLLERDFARRAGLGWFGKNTMLIDKRCGSYLLLGALLLDLALHYDEPHATSHCGTCTACLDACPTEAFAGPGWLDARRCISYLTIEHRGDYEAALRGNVGDWLFGCDICQEVCPWNRHATQDAERLDATEVLRLSDDEFRARFRGTALFRSKRAGLARNAAIVLGNSGDPEALPALRASLADTDQGVREAAIWAIARIEDRTP